MRPTYSNAVQSTQFIKAQSLLILLIVLLVVACGPAEEEKRPPNFLFILVDDQSPFDLQVYDAQSPLETPNIDRLAREGMVLDQAYHMGSWSGAVCTPSRHMIMLGRSLWRLPDYGRQWSNPEAPDSIELQSIPAVFNRAGYKTMRTCKKGNSYAAANALFQEVHDASKRGGTAETGSAWHGQQVLNYLEKRSSSQEQSPFLIYMGFSHPHDPRNGTPELLAKYGATNHSDTTSLPPANDLQPALQDNYLLEHPFFHGHPSLRDEERVEGVWKRRDERTVRNELGREYACAENIDIQIGKVLAQLEAMGELDNTYVIYTSDHGIAIGRHGLMGKQNLYEHTWRVPFIVKGPGIPSGKRAKGNIYLMDILPTLCDLADLRIPETVDAQTFTPVLRGEKGTIRDVMYGVYCGGTKPGMRSVRQGDWKLIKYDMMDGDVREKQLFHLAENPNEYLAEHRRTAGMETDLAEDPQFADKLEEMEALLSRQMIARGDPYEFWDQN